jgi:hypothetical protein
MDCASSDAYLRPLVVAKRFLIFEQLRREQWRTALIAAHQLFHRLPLRKQFLISIKLQYGHRS